MPFNRLFLKWVFGGLLIPAALMGQAPNPRVSTVVKVIRRSAPAVVTISAEVRQQNPFFDPFFFFLDPDQRENPYVQNSLGSGFLVDQKGFILTNEHVVAGGQRILVHLPGVEKAIRAKIVGSAPEQDLALLKIPSPHIRPLPLGKSSDLMPGETLIAIGNPYGLEQTVSTGVLSAKNRSVNVGNRTFNDFLQTDAAINPGNSGGPLLNILGKVIGVNSAIRANAQNIGFAIPIDRARRVMDELRTSGKVADRWLGILVGERADRPGVRILRVYPFRGDAAAQLHRGDKVVRLEGQPIRSMGDWNGRLAALKMGTHANVVLKRKDQVLKATLLVHAPPSIASPGIFWSAYGFRQTKLRLTAIRQGSPAEDLGLRPGDRIVGWAGQRVKTSQDLAKQAGTTLAKPAVPLTIQRRAFTYNVTMRMWREK